MSDLPPSGWYPDPGDDQQQRYWDGTSWTDHTAPAHRASSPQSSQEPVEQWPSARQPAYASPGLGTEAPDPWMWQSIVATVLCCLSSGIAGLIGIGGIINASKSQKAAAAGDLAEARRTAKLARTFTIATLVVGLLFTVLILAVLVTGVAVPADFT